MAEHCRTSTLRNLQSPTGNNTSMAAARTSRGSHITAPQSRFVKRAVVTKLIRHARAHARTHTAPWQPCVIRIELQFRQQQLVNQRSCACEIMYRLIKYVQAYTTTSPVSNLFLR
jgi:hypothetical protein